jgi:hypothetical protein
MHYWSIFLYIVGTDFYTLLLATDDVASLLAENLLKPSPTTSGVPRRLQPGLPVGSGSAPLATGLLPSPPEAGSAADMWVRRASAVAQHGHEQNFCFTACITKFLCILKLSQMHALRGTVSSTHCMLVLSNFSCF